MMSLCDKAFVLIVAALCALSVAASASGQNYAWNRTTETVEASSDVSVQVEGVPEVADEDFDTDFTGGPAVSGKIVTDTQTAYGGGGGGGGDGANLNGNGDDGEDYSAVDGAAGQDAIGGGGAGGKAGANGSAYGRSHADGQSQLNPDGQLSMSWTFIHNQDAQLTLLAAGGGGGGGQGGHAEEEGGPGGDGGDGGSGRCAFGKVISRQESDVDAEAELEFGPDADENTPEETVARAVVNITWGRSGYEMENDGDDEFQGDVWARGMDVNVTFGDASLNLSGGPTGSLEAYGITGDEEEFYKESVDNLEDASGSFGIGQSEFWDYISVGDSASISADETAPYSRLVGEMSRDGGGGGQGAQDESGGDDGDDGDEGGGASGGQGGQGGEGGEPEADDGEEGGDGGAGGSVTAHEAGLFQGVIEIRVDN